ncbi:MAG: hypothetical protein ABL876_02160 [Chitinophagaceae bacterium]
MKKSALIISSILLMLTFLTHTAKAKSPSLLLIPCSVTGDLSDRLAADKDFQAYSIYTYEFIVKVRETKTGNLLVKYFNQTANAVEKETLAFALGYHSEEGVKSFLINAYKLKNDLNQKFPELREFEKYQADIRTARSKVAISVLRPHHTAEDCWDLFFAISTLCSTTCLTATEWSSCWIDCYAGLGGVITVCLIAAD